MKALVTALKVMIPCLCISLASCAVAHFYNTPKIQKQFFQSIQKSETLATHMNDDFVQKKVLLGNLKRTPPKGFSGVSDQLSDLLKRMEASISEINRLRLQMGEYNGQMSALNRGRKTIRSSDPEWDRAGEVIDGFKATTKAFGTESAQYKTLSDQFSAIISQNKFYETANVTELEGQMAQTVVTANQNLDLMNTQMKQLNTLLSDFDDPGKDAQTSVTKLKSLAKAYLSDTMRIEDIRKSLRAAARGADKITSTDPQWQAFDKLVKEAMSKKNQLAKLSKTFLKEAQHLQDIIKENQ